jgi:hypothetical protein
MQAPYYVKGENIMAGKLIVAAVEKELRTQNKAGVGYDNYQYPDSGSSYSNDDTDDSPSEQ